MDPPRMQLYVNDRPVSGAYSDAPIRIDFVAMSPMPAPTSTSEIIAPEFLAWGHAEAADEAYHRAIADAGTGWGQEERAAYKPVEAARIAARRAWVAAGCPVTARRS